ncbi:MAG: peptide MFS transporter [Bacteroidales bacterium]
MFKNHPKGLLAASLANMGERFGFYTMMAILVLFLQAKFGLSGGVAGTIYSIFYASIYILALVGGIIADKTKNFKGTILVGLIVMALGYVILAIPIPITIGRTLALVLTCAALFVIAFGNGLFKGNLQALVGKMYDNPKYSQMRDSGFSLFYMFINVGAIFAPFIAVGVRNWWLGKNGFGYNAALPELCHKQLDGTITGAEITEFTTAATHASAGVPVTDLTAFSNTYLDVFSTGFHYAFGVAIFAMIISIAVYLVNRKGFPGSETAAEKEKATKEQVEMDIKEIKQRLYALFAVFGVVIFFWMSFHQNGLSLTMFARDYTDLSQIKINLGFTTIQGAEIFQSINPICVVLLTPVIMGLFGWLRAKGIEPSTPRKIAIGMGIAALGFAVMAIGSHLYGLPDFAHKGGLTDIAKASPMLLIGTYVILTVAELFISPLGLSFVSKVAPPQYQGIMQGAWLGATAVGNSLLFVGALLYESMPLWATWSVFIVACLLSMFTMIFMLKWLERVAK